MPPKRKSATKATSKMTAKQAGPKKAAPAAPATEPKRRGRPPKAKVEIDEEATEEVTETTKPTPRARGRPKAAAKAAPPASTSSKRKRNAEAEDEEAAEADVEDAKEPPKKRGRPSKTSATPSKPIAPPKKPKGYKAASSKVSKSATGPKKPAAKRGRPPKVTVPTANGTANGHDLDSDPEDQADEPCDQDAPTDLQYWLMKAEPETRMENGVDVSYPIDKLAAATLPEPWDGVRNFSARNNMRAMRKGDLAFFYHSNCKVPGIVGVMRIAEEHSVDDSAFDPAHPYYDAKSDRSKPKWDCVKVEFVKKFDNMVTLQTLKTTEELSDMQIASKSFSRLSVQAVKPDEWDFVLELAGEDPALGQDGKPTKPLNAGEPDGYEAGTDGETEKDVGGANAGGLEDDEAADEAERRGIVDNSEDVGPKPAMRAESSDDSDPAESGDDSDDEG